MLDNLPLEKLVRDLPAPVMIIEPSGKILFANTALCNLFEYSKQELISMEICDLAATKDEGEIYKSILRLSIQLNESHGRFLARNKTRHGNFLETDWEWTSLIGDYNTFLVLYDKDITERKHMENEYINKVKMLEVEIENRKKIERALNLAHTELAEKVIALEAQRKINEKMLLELEEKNEMLERLAMEDSLTGILNRRSFTYYLTTELIRAQHFKQTLSLLILDLDHFKSINDSLGHLAGDKVLIKVAQSIQESIGCSSFLCRYGGEEFAIIAPGYYQKTTQILANKILNDLAYKPMDINNKQINITASIGASSIKPYEWEAPLEAISEYMIKAADQSLYKAKAAGRNQAVVYKHNLMPVKYLASKTKN
mgnify:FL=1